MSTNGSTSPVISVENVRKQYNSRFRKGVKALDGVTFDVRPGEVFALLGPNGAGKTTLVKVLLGIIRRSGGTATMLGFPAGDRRSRTRVGYLPEHLRIPRHQTARTALDFYGKLSGMSGAEVASKRDTLLDRVGLAGRDRESVKRFSKGMLQRLGLAQALLHDPDLLILDEPTDGLDPVGRSNVRSILDELRAEGRTVFLNSHLLQEVELVCDRVAILDKGVLKFVGTLEELTPSEEAGEIEIEFTGTQDQVREVFKFWEPADDWKSGKPHVMNLNVSSQSESDAFVDRFRAAGVSIHSLSRRGRTLEDAFLKLVGETIP